MAEQADRFERAGHYKRLRHDQYLVEDERGWAGQYGQHPVNEEEKSYQPANPHQAAK